MEKKACKRCGRNVSNDLKLCPYCGHKLENKIYHEKVEKNNNISSKEKITDLNLKIDSDTGFKIIFGLIIAIVVIIVLVAAINANNNYLRRQKNNTSSNINESVSNKEVLDITSDSYINKMSSIIENAVADSKYFSFQGGYTHSPYLEYTYYPVKKYDKELMREQAKVISQVILSNLQKYEYKKGSIFVSNFEYINIHFYYYDDLGRLSRGDGFWVQFDMTKINSQTIDDIKVQ